MNTGTKLTPKKLGKYQVIEKLATGSMGVVYEGYDPIAKRSVAIKVSLSEHIKDKRQAHRYNELFVREAKTASLLHHPNILEVFDRGIDQGRHFIVMELVKHARTIKDYISKEALLTSEQALDLIIQSAEGLEYAHTQGVIHRDIKPANILVTENMQVKIADFSIAFVNQSNSELAMPTGFVGSPRYMSPEQVQEDAITFQTDLYSLGVVMYELLTGRHPFEADSFSRLIYQVVNEDPPDPLSIKPDLPEELANCMRRALVKDPARRFQSASAMIADLKRIYTDQPSIEFEQEKNEFESIRTEDIPVGYGKGKYSESLSLPLGFFTGFDENERQLFSDGCSLQKFEQGDCIIRQNESGDSFYILVKGRLSIESINVGESFAEMAFLSGELQPESITALSPVEVFVIDKNLLESLPIPCQLVIYKTLAERLSQKVLAANNVESFLSDAS